jgi:hypothetical protein
LKSNRLKYADVVAMSIGLAKPPGLRPHSHAKKVKLRLRK